MVSSEYQTCCSVRKAQSEATVNGPIRPVYMINMTISLLAGWSCGVMPVDRPTVPKADVASNKSCRNVRSGSRRHRMNVPPHTTNADSSVTIKAFWTTSPATVRRNAVGIRPVAALRVACRRANSVVVFMPPPVEPGDAPTNMRRIKTNRPASVNEPIG